LDHFLELIGSNESFKNEFVILAEEADHAFEGVLFLKQLFGFFQFLVMCLFFVKLDRIQSGFE